MCVSGTVIALTITTSAGLHLAMSVWKTQNTWNTWNIRNQKCTYAVNEIMESILQSRCEMSVGESHNSSKMGTIDAWISVPDRFKIISECYVPLCQSRKSGIQWALVIVM